MKPSRFLSVGLVLVTSIPFSFAAPALTYRDLRYTAVIGQTDWYTCGPAALATLFTYYYGTPVSEQEFTTLSVQDMATRGKDPADGVTLLSLRNASRTKGIDAAGYKLTPAALREVLAAGLPILVNVVQPELHFTVVIGIDGDQVLTADPSWGLKVQPMRQFLDAWNGVVLIPQLNEQQQVIARREVAQVLATYRNRQERLKAGL